MRIVIATDSFKGTLRADEACNIISDTVLGILPDVDVPIKPMADGGEGTARALIAATGGQWTIKQVMGPLEQMSVEAGFAWLPDKTAVVEMASASGLELLTKEQRDPMKTTTYGTGEVVQAAMDYGAHKILLAVGGSATVDGGVGAAMALGWKFLDKNGELIPLGGKGLERIVKIVPTGRFLNPHEERKKCPIQVLCDVDNPLCGEQGAARIYGPQKGATPEMVERLEAGLVHLAELVRGQLHRDIANERGAGAAGGLAAGAMAFMNATLASGIETVMAYSKLRDELEFADWVITGEGCFDRQSLSGKVVAGVLKMARQTKTRVAVIAGEVNLSREEYSKMGIDVALATKPDDMPLDVALENTRTLLRSASRRFIEKYLL
jgi:glycerate kinase